MGVWITHIMTGSDTQDVYQHRDLTIIRTIMKFTKA